MRQETYKCLSVESVACNSSYQFSKRLLQQCGEMYTLPRASLEAKVIDLKERMYTCMTRGDKTLIVVKVLEAPARHYQHGVYFYYHTVHTHKRIRQYE